MASSTLRCQGIKSDGTQCSLKTKDGKKFCHVHEAKTVIVTDENISPPPSTFDDTFTDILADVTARLLNLEVQKKILASKKRLVSPKNIETTALRIFYHDHKNNETMLAEVRQRLASAQLLFSTKNNATHIPWTIIKRVTDAEFAKLPQDQKDVYIARARQAIADKM